MGRHVPAAPGRRRLHDADQGARRRDDRGPGPRDRRGGRRVRRGARRQPRLREPLRRPHDAPGHSAALDPHRRRPPDLAAVLGRRADHGAGLRRLGPQRLLVPGLGHRRQRGRRRVARGRRPSRPSSPATASTPTCRGSSRSPSPAARRTAPGSRSTTSACGRPSRRTARSASTCSSAAGSPTASAWPRTSTSSSGPTRPSSSAGASPSSSASWATGRTAAWPACATWPRSSAPRGSGRPSTSAPTFALEPAGRELTTAFRGDHVGVHPQKQPGLVYVGCSVPVGRMHGIELVELARLAETYGDGGVRIGTDQNFIVSGVPEERLDDLLAEPLMQTYSPFPGPFERGVVACTGSEFCRFAVVETKERAVKWARALDAQLSSGDEGASAATTRGHPDALLGLLGLVRPAPDRRHRVPGRHRARRRAHRGGRRHRSGRLARSRRRVHRLGRRARCRSTRCPTRCSGWSAATARSAVPASRSTSGRAAPTPDDLRSTLVGAAEAVTS